MSIGKPHLWPAPPSWSWKSSGMTPKTCISRSVAKYRTQRLTPSQSKSWLLRFGLFPSTPFAYAMPTSTKFTTTLCRSYLRPRWSFASGATFLPRSGPRTWRRGCELWPIPGLLSVLASAPDGSLGSLDGGPEGLSNDNERFGVTAALGRLGCATALLGLEVDTTVCPPAALACRVQTDVFPGLLLSLHTTFAELLWRTSRSKCPQLKRPLSCCVTFSRIGSRPLRGRTSFTSSCLPKSALPLVGRAQST
mmetsp:Transcript_376/g.1123  ORF Transcript_376/g.1123 Transcript_376/m.1123 type:complete len:250 (-) Transcript_376:543-1292(-)